MPQFVTLHLDTGPGGIATLEMPGATTLEHAALRFADHLGLDTDGFSFFLIDRQTHQPYAGEGLAGEYGDIIFDLGYEKRGATG